jgi:glyoxylase-like metal-dependent hydrolase (beta-lactamase superfamily II)
LTKTKSFQQNERLYNQRSVRLYDLIKLEEDFFCAAHLGSSWPTSSNIFIIADTSGLALIDTGIDNSDCFASFASCLEKTGHSIEDVHTILLTHGHPDHIGGTNTICRYADPRILISEASISEAVDLQQQDYYCLPPHVRSIAPHMRSFDLMGNFRRTCGSWELKERRLNSIQDGAVIKVGRYALQAIHTPGHDIGLMCFYDSTHKILFTGDLLRSNGAGSALPWYTSTAGGVDAYLKSLERMDSLDVRNAFTAHGPVKSDFLTMLKDTREIILGREETILSLLAEGPKTCEELDTHLYRPIVLKLCPWFSTVTEAHLSRLEKLRVVKRNELNYHLA